ncbi:MAG: Asp23/Gls24 family envelope stress response protein [Hamadaea sp.]|uniref:Asp23/Gls24 family envelope stress response protein n=1 Tax=Hamadaea sp. TaxID=2024425 RepID=UPI00183FAE56|nr:Asp23/Gls24 family envelope stress response protein [Hamadaea sp.]NUR70364.1 Asp23/Gls24 family envelope stress response protein [Hamadaea sp.]NUT20524.1 Asp23/Gls24 family envelope stress response protein [Hamadaea sp.]
MTAALAPEKQDTLSELADAVPVGGAVHIKDDVVAKLAAYLATEVPDVGGPARGLSRLPLGGQGADLNRRPLVSAHVDGGRAYLDVTASVRWPASVAEVTTEVRRHLRERIHELTGLEVGEVRIEVTDLITETPHARVS